MDNMWKGPARLCRCRDLTAVDGGRAAPEELAMGSLEAMVRRAAASLSEASAAERAAIRIDAGGDTMLAWSDIERLRRSPRFPVEI